MGGRQIAPQWISICALALGDWRLALFDRDFPRLSFMTWIEEPARHSNIISAKTISICTAALLRATFAKIEWISSGTGVRLLAAGAPCQPFSMGGSRKGHGDKRNLFPTLLKAVRVLCPRAVLIENVRGLERGSHRPYLDYLLRQLRYTELSPNQSEAWEDHDQRLRQQRYRREGPCHISRGLGRLQCRRLRGISNSPSVIHRGDGVGSSRISVSSPNTLEEKITLRTGFRRLLGQARAPRSSNKPKAPPQTTTRAALLPWVTVRDRTSGLPPPSFEENDGMQQSLEDSRRTSIPWSHR